MAFAAKTVVKRAARSLASSVILIASLSLHQVAVANADPTSEPRASAKGLRATADEQWSSEEAAIEVPSFALPESYYLGTQSRALVRNDALASVGAAFRACPNLRTAPLAQLSEARACQARAFLATPLSKRLKAKYPVEITPQRVGGIETEVFTPTAGVSEQNKHRVLINLHGGAFLFGWQTLSRVESMPIAATAKIKVVSVDYRHAPEALFPAGSEDVVAVYRELLRTHKPSEIGIYGCSAGGILTAQTVAMLLQEDLPVPGAIGMFCGAGGNSMLGDSVAFTQALYRRPADFLQLPYFQGADLADARVSPALAADVIGRFPPSLLISSSRDHQLSSVLFTHSRLVATGVSADLHVWEGLGHAFFYDPDLHESEEVYRVIATFFDKHLSS